MDRGDIITAKIHNVRFHKEERKIAGELFGNYCSEYVAVLEGYTNSIVCIDSIAQQLHPNWDRKTEQRAQILSQELQSKTITARVVDVFRNGVFEAELI